MKVTRAARMELVDDKKKKVVEELNVPTRISNPGHKKAGVPSWLECHKRSTRAINQDPGRPFLMHHLVVETTVQLKECQKKGVVFDRLDVVSRVALEVLESESNVAAA